MTNYKDIKSFLVDAYYSHEITPADYVFLSEKVERLEEEQRQADEDFRKRMAALFTGMERPY